MINDRGALCVGRRCRSGEWMKGLLPPCLLLCYVYNYNNDTRRWNQKKKKEEKLGISYLKIYSRIDLHLRWFCYSRNYCVYLQPYRCSCWRSHISKKCKRVKDFFSLPCTQFLLTCWYYTRFPTCAKSAQSFCLIMTFRSVGCYKMSSFPCRLFFTFSLFEFFFASEFPIVNVQKSGPSSDDHSQPSQHQNVSIECSYLWRKWLCSFPV